MEYSRAEPRSFVPEQFAYNPESVCVRNQSVYRGYGRRDAYTHLLFAVNLRKVGIERSKLAHELFFQCRGKVALPHVGYKLRNARLHKQIIFEKVFVGAGLHGSYGAVRAGAALRRRGHKHAREKHSKRKHGD